MREKNKQNADVLFLKKLKKTLKTTYILRKTKNKSRLKATKIKIYKSLLNTETNKIFRNLKVNTCSYNINTYI